MTILDKNDFLKITFRYTVSPMNKYTPPPNIFYKKVNFLIISNERLNKRDIKYYLLSNFAALKL